MYEGSVSGDYRGLSRKVKDEGVRGEHVRGSGNYR